MGMPAKREGLYKNSMDLPWTRPSAVGLEKENCDPEQYLVGDLMCYILCLNPLSLQ